MSGNKTDAFLAGKVLIAMPNMPDERFARTVVYICAHSRTGAMGLVINRVAEDLSLGRLLAQLDVSEEPETDEDVSPGSQVGSTKLPPSLSAFAETPIFVGGPVETKRGFVLHSSDYFAAGASVRVGEGVCLTASFDILQAIATGKGPRNSMMALGYSGWGAGQLEREIQANSWLHVDAPAELLFATDVEHRYHEALGLLGIDPSFLVGTAGHA